MLPPPNADGGGIDVVVPAGAPPAGIPPVAMTAVLAPAPEKEKVTSLTKNNPDTGVLLAYFDATPAYAKTSELPHDPNLALVWSPGESGRMTANKYKRSQVKSLFLKWKDAIAEAAFLSRVETFAELEGALLARIAPAPDLLAIALKAHPFKPFIAEHLPDAWRIFSSVAADAASEPLFVGVRAKLIALVAKRSICSLAQLRKDMMAYTAEVQELTETSRDTFVEIWSGMELYDTSVAPEKDECDMRSLFTLLMTNYENALGTSCASSDLNSLDTSALKDDTVLNTKLNLQSAAWLEVVGYIAGWLLNYIGIRGKAVKVERRRTIVRRAWLREIVEKNEYVHPSPSAPPAPWLLKIERVTLGHLKKPCEDFFHLVCAFEFVFENALTTENLLAYQGEIVRKCYSAIQESPYIASLAKIVMTTLSIADPSPEAVSEFIRTIAFWYSQMRGRDFVRRVHGNARNVSITSVVFRSQIAAKGAAVTGHKVVLVDKKSPDSMSIAAPVTAASTAASAMFTATTSNHLNTATAPAREAVSDCESSGDDDDDADESIMIMMDMDDMIDPPDPDDEDEDLTEVSATDAVAGVLLGYNLRSRVVQTN